MSTYGTALVIDTPSGSSPAAPASWRAGTAEPAAGWSRLSAYCDGIDQVPVVERLLADAGSGRAAIAEDHDEYGALWVVLAAEDGRVRTVHRRYVLNADPGDAGAVAAAVADHGTDPRDADVAGEGPAAEAAALFGAEPEAMVEAERAADLAYQELGVVGGPFPWWDALGLPWPE